jgi:hypothetical protein
MLQTQVHIKLIIPEDLGREPNTFTQPFKLANGTFSALIDLAQVEHCKGILKTLTLSSNEG